MFYKVSPQGVGAMLPAMPKKLPRKLANYPHLQTRPEKTNPYGDTDTPAVSRMLASYEWRSTVRRVLKTRDGAAALENHIAIFAATKVRGDFVPTMAEAYADMVRIVNEGGAV